MRTKTWCCSMAMLVVSSALAGCSEQSRPRDDDATTLLRRAANATLDSEHWVMSVAGADGVVSYTVNFIAPERARLVTRKGDRTIETIEVDSRIFSTDPEIPGNFHEYDFMNDDIIVQTALTVPMALASATAYGHENHWVDMKARTSSDYTLTGRTYLSSGRLDKIDVKTELGVATFQFSNYDSAPQIEVPPPSKISVPHDNDPDEQCTLVNEIPPGEIRCENVTVDLSDMP